MLARFPMTSDTLKACHAAVVYENDNEDMICCAEYSLILRIDTISATLAAALTILLGSH